MENNDIKNINDGANAPSGLIVNEGSESDDENGENVTNSAFVSLRETGLV